MQSVATDCQGAGRPGVEASGRPAHAPGEELLRFVRAIRPARRRSMREFAESEIIIPEGPFVGRKFKCARQPYTGLLFDSIDSGLWTEFYITGPVQSGKTLSGAMVPLLWHLFEVGEKVIFGLPDMNMAADKWGEEILPVIEASRYRDLLPSYGAGSRGGAAGKVTFKNGSVLKFMSGGGQDKKRAGFTARAIIITEADGLDERGTTSREGSKLGQIKARAKAWAAHRRRIYLECTVSTEDGATWAGWERGTASRILLLCPECGKYVHPEREHLIGWRDAKTEQEARERARFVCPGCSIEWSEQQRTQANADAVLVHRGQDPPAEGAEAGEHPPVISSSGSMIGGCGPMPQTHTLGFRYTAVHNQFLSAADVAVDEWKAARAPDQDEAEITQLQQVWVLPHKPAIEDAHHLDAGEIAERAIGLPRGLVPAGHRVLTVGIDVGKRWAHWCAISWGADGSGQVIDYGVIEIPSDYMALEVASLAALREFAEQIGGPGWQRSDDGMLMPPDQIVIDAGWQGSTDDPDYVYQLVLELGDPWICSKGFGGADYRGGRSRKYVEPGKGKRRTAGHRYHVKRTRKCGQITGLLEFDADHWKSYAHQRLTTPVGSAGALTLFEAQPIEHLTFCKHLVAEQRRTEWKGNKGAVVRWVTMGRHNHYLDAVTEACVAAHRCGVRVLSDAEASAGSPARSSPARSSQPVRRDWFKTQRAQRRRRRFRR